MFYLRIRSSGLWGRKLRRTNVQHRPAHILSLSLIRAAFHGYKSSSANSGCFHKPQGGFNSYRPPSAAHLRNPLIIGTTRQTIPNNLRYKNLLSLSFHLIYILQRSQSKPQWYLCHFFKLQFLFTNDPQTSDVTLG